MTLSMPSLSLEEWRRQMGLHPYFFWGMADSSVLRVTQQSDPVLKKYAYQDGDDVGRDDILEAIVSAEQKLRAYLNFRPGPQYTEATVLWPALGDTRLTRIIPSGAGGGWLGVFLPEGEIRAVGIEGLTFISTPVLTYSDPDGDGINELATCTVATTITDTAQIAAYFQASDRLNGDAAGEEYRIRPVTVSISGGVATIRIPSWLLVRPIQYEGFDLQSTDLNPATAGVLASSIDIYQRTTNTNGTTAATSQAVIIWETSPSHGWWCCCANCGPNYNGSPFDPAAIAQSVARVGIYDARLGIVTPAPASYDATTGIWSAFPASICQEPDRVLVRYLAGVASPDGQQLAREWQIAVARLATAELTRPICAKYAANRAITHWQFDRARATGADDESYQIGPGDLDNPFGTRMGQIDAWKRVKRLELTRGIYGG